MLETELQVEMRRFVGLSETWSGFHKFKILCAWMGTTRMREMNDFLGKQTEEAKLHAERRGGE